MRLLAETYFAFEGLHRALGRQMGLTTSQFDVIATLGNTEGMSFRELGEKTLITKGTLTGVIERLVRDGLVQRRSGPNDKRIIIVQLSARGEKAFTDYFLPTVSVMKRAFKGYQRADYDALDAALTSLRDGFDSADPTLNVEPYKPSHGKN